MEKKRGLSPFAILFLVGLLGLNIYFFASKKAIYSPASGMFIKELPMGLNMSVIAFVLQWVILLMIILFAYTKFLKHKQEEEKKIEGFVLPQLNSRSETYMDIFYKLLKEKQNLSVGVIAKAFKITKEKALDWAKILEDNDLVTIEYPAFSDAEVKINGIKKQEEKIKDKGEKNTQIKKQNQQTIQKTSQNSQDKISQQKNSQKIIQKQEEKK